MALLVQLSRNKSVRQAGQMHILQGLSVVQEGSLACRSVGSA